MEAKEDLVRENKRLSEPSPMGIVSKELALEGSSKLTLCCECQTTWFSATPKTSH